MKRNKSNNVKTHVNDKTDYKTDAANYESWFTDYKIDNDKTDYKTDNDKTNYKTDNNKTDYESWFIWSVFAGTVLLAIYSILHKFGII